MALGTAIVFASAILELAPAVISAGIDAYEFFTWADAKVRAFKDEKRDPTPAEWNELNAKTAEMRTLLHTDDPTPHDE